MDNAAVHKINFNTEDYNIKVIFLPPNSTTLIQHMDQGVNAVFKKGYRKKL